MQPICGQCGRKMEYTKIAPCFECGARPNEIDDLEKEIHQYYYFPLFDNAIFCDFCINDIESTEPEYWGFPPKFDWEKDSNNSGIALCEHVKLSVGWICTSCFCTENQQKFVIVNAKRYGQKIPNTYWKYLTEQGVK